LEERMLRLAEYWAREWSTCYVQVGAVLAVGNRVIYRNCAKGLPAEAGRVVTQGCNSLASRGRMDTLGVGRVVTPLFGVDSLIKK